MDEEFGGWLAGTWNGLYQSQDGIDWSHVDGYTYRVTSIAREDGRICVGVGSGLWEVSRGSEIWVQLHDETLTEVLDLMYAPGDPGVVAASAYGVGRSFREGSDVVRWSWPSDYESVNDRFTNSIEIDSADPTRWIAGTENGVRIGEESGSKWISSTLIGTPVRSVRRIADTWWAGSDGQGVWKSANGVEWEQAGTGLDGETVFSVADCSGKVLLGTETGVAVGDGVGKWENVGPQARVASVAADSKNPRRWMAGCSPGGLWVTEDAGKGWRYIAGMEMNSVEAILAPGGHRS